MTSPATAARGLNKVFLQEVGRDCNQLETGSTRSLSMARMGYEFAAYARLKTPHENHQE